MKSKFIILIIIFLSFLFAETEYERLINKLDEAVEDSLRYQILQDSLLHLYPASEKAFEIAQSEFYDKIYPIWLNDSLKVIAITKLLDKYQENDWQRTMFQYLTYSLHNLGKITTLKQVLVQFRNSFPEDYIAYYQTARYYKRNDLNGAIQFAKMAHDRSSHYPVLEHYPPMQWALEQRAATVNTAALYGELLVEQEDYQKAEQVLRETIKATELGVNDEATLSGCYYILAKCYEKTGEKEKAVQAAIRSLVAGDSRNRYPARADSLLRKMIAHKDLSETEYRDFIRVQADYDDVIFEDVTAEMGLQHATARRVAWGDYNRDGFEDLLLDGRKLFLNEKGKRFRNITELVFTDTIKANGGLWADLDNDGDLDILTKDPESVWLNRKNRFYKVTGENALHDNNVSTEGVGIADVNEDGWLDVYLANYEVWKDNNSHPESDQFFRGIGDGKFYEATDRADLLPADGAARAGRGVNMADFNNDGDIDIFVSNYRLQDNFLWINDGEGHFHNKASKKGVAGIETDGWWGHTIGSCWGDIDNDADLDLFCANLAHPRYIDFSNKSMLYLNSGAPDHEFTDIREQAGIRFEETHSEPVLADFDNDGFLDLYINCVYENRRSFLYMNNGNNTFREVSFLAGVRHFNGWGCATADFDNDGDLDLIAAGGKLQLFRNETSNNNNWLQVDIVGNRNIDAIGTRLQLTKNEFTKIAEIFGAKGTTNQDSFIQHFGLGKQEPPFYLTIRFPDDSERKIDVTDIDQRIIIEQ